MKGKVEKLTIDKIKIGKRLRHDMGDLESLKDSLKSLGQLNPIIVDDRLRLLSGERRLRAAKDLGWQFIDAKVMPPKDALERIDVEIEENLHRKAFTTEELAEAMSKREDLRQRQNMKPCRYWWYKIKQFFKRDKKALQEY